MGSKVLSTILLYNSKSILRTVKNESVYCTLNCPNTVNSVCIQYWDKVVCCKHMWIKFTNSRVIREGKYCDLGPVHVNGFISWEKIATGTWDFGNYLASILCSLKCHILNTSFQVVIAAEIINPIWLSRPVLNYFLQQFTRGASELHDSYIVG